jgi:hypothetical protein
LCVQLFILVRSTSSTSNISSEAIFSSPLLDCYLGSPNPIINPRHNTHPTITESELRTPLLPVKMDPYQSATATAANDEDAGVRPSEQAAHEPQNEAANPERADPTVLSDNN